MSRIKAVLRRAGKKEDSKMLHAGGLELNTEGHTVFAEGERIGLSLKEYELLELFMEHPGRVFMRGYLLERIWEVDYVGETRTVDVHVATLRTKMGKYGAYIRTVRGVGCKMEENV